MCLHGSYFTSSPCSNSQMQMVQRSGSSPTSALTLYSITGSYAIILGDKPRHTFPFFSSSWRSSCVWVEVRFNFSLILSSSLPHRSFHLCWHCSDHSLLLQRIVASRIEAVTALPGAFEGRRASPLTTRSVCLGRVG